MNEKLTVVFDKSNEDVPVLVVARENSFGFLSGPTMQVINTITGQKAIDIWSTLDKDYEDRQKAVKRMNEMFGKERPDVASDIDEEEDYEDGTDGFDCR